MEPLDKLDALALMWSQAKQKEEAARDERVDIEQKILALHPAKEEGSESFQTPTGVKIKLTGKLTYKVDVDKLIALTGSWPADIRPIKTETKADESKLKAIRAQVPKLWADIAEAVTVTPAKTGVAIDFKE
jgi:hypothetical protein